MIKAKVRVRYGRKKRFQIAMRIVCGLSFLALLGIAGGSDANQLTMKQILTWAPIALATFGLSGYLGGLMR